MTLLLFSATTVQAQALQKSAIQVDPGNTKLTGQTFGYRLTYNCSNTSGPCPNAEVIDLLPPEVQYISTVPASPTGDVQAINVTPNFMGSGRTRVQFVLINPLPAGNSGDLLINVRFPNGTTPNGTTATNTADGINLGTTPGTFTTPPVTVTAVATLQTTLQKTLQTSPANLDLPESYRLRISVPNNSGALGLTALGPVVDTLPPGTVFNGATPAADCQPGCVGTTPATLVWTSPCSVPLNPGNSCDITVNVTFPSATFPSGSSVTNSFTADATPLGGAPTNLGVGQLTHPVTTFVPAPGASLSKGIAGGSPNPPTLNQTYSYDIAVGNNGNVPLDTLVLIDSVPVALQISSVTTGAYSGASDFAAGVGVEVSYEKNTALGVFTLWGGSPNTTTSTTLSAPPPGLGAGEYITRVRWQYGQVQPGMTASTRPLITGRIINPDNAGNPVAFGNTVQNCVNLSAVYSAGPTPVTRNSCHSFVVSGPFVQLNPAKENLSGGGPFNPGQAVSWRLRVRSAPQSSDPVALESLVATDLLPVNLVFSSWTFDDRGTGLPAPQVFQQIPNFAGTGRTLLRWRWNAGSGNLGVNQEVWINATTTIRNGAVSGSLSNDLTLDSDAPGLGLRCSSASQADVLDLDGDADTAETLCRATGTITVAGIAQLVSSKSTRGVCEAAYASTGTTLPGGRVEYRVQVSNPGTVAMQDIVLIDLLPAIGDTGVRDTTPRGSLWQPLLTGPIVPPAGTTLYYTTAANPCRGEVGGPTTGCTAPNWTTAAPDPITAVRGFKLEFGDRVIAPFDTLSFEFAMVGPTSLPAGPAYNSFAYLAQRADGLGALAAEPLKVGVAPGNCPTAPALGDYVWLDNNGNGLQDETGTGINGVTVLLYGNGSDGVSGTADDIQAQSVTQDSPGGQPGWYRFPNLSPGRWRVCIVPPASTLPSPADQGSDDALDSDANTATSCSPLVTLAGGEENLSLDFGLIPAAALGNYVWFDRDGDGRQNEPASEGVNGVSVRLYADDGDGNAEPGADDALVGVTATDFDAFGNPGYYLFRDLVPGQRYFVHFVLPPNAGAFTGADAGGDDTQDSDAGSGGTTTVRVLAPGEFDASIDAGLVLAAADLSLGDQIWLDADNDGIYEPQNGETGIDDVALLLYRDANGNGSADADEYVGATASGVASGFAGRYRFNGLTPGNYLVVVAPSNFAVGGALVGLTTASGNDPAPDPDDDVNGDDNGLQDGALIVSRAITLTSNGEPTSEDGDNRSNLTLDFGFIAQPAPLYDYGDAPDAGTGSGTGNYATTAFDAGPVHRIGAPGAPYLGDCVDADDGTAQDIGAAADDGLAGATVGSCLNAGDDEDGVAFATPFTPGATATFTVRAGPAGACLLSAWVDWNADGQFGGGGEQIANGVSVAAGSTVSLTPTVPTGAALGTTYARFRCASSAVATPTGAAADGEVEDYRIEIGGSDFADAPASYATQGAGAARHAVSGPDPLRLGQCVDLESDGQPNAAADGDDRVAGARFGLCFNDEDGVAFTSQVNACQNATATVTANAAGLLDAWIDYNQDGDFSDAGEAVAASLPLVAGANALSFAVPCAAGAGNKYARFRLSSAGGLGPAGAAADGEVEDYVVGGVRSDFGDAPAGYGTLLADDGPRHAAIAGFSLGASVDGEPDGQPSAAANGDGADEDGVSFAAPTLDACATTSIGVSLTNTAALATPRLDAWIDFNRDGDWSDAGERIANGLALNAGVNTVSVNVPCTVAPGPTYARFRLSSTGSATPLGAAIDGEVEDYRLVQRGADYGDAPDSYQTLSASGGALHRVDPASSLYLGSCVDTETDGQPGIAASGDDTNPGTAQAGSCSGSDDEDGAVFALPLVACRSASVSVTAGAAGQLDGWIDFDRDGSFEAAERIFDHRAIAAGSTSLNFTVPCSAVPGATYARLRLSSSGSNGPAGVADDGEVEDHALTLAGIDYGDAPDSYATSAAAGGPTHALTQPALFLGSCVDSEADAATPLDGSGDDAATGGSSSGTCGVGGDEDGVVFPSVLTSCKVTPVTVQAAASSRLDAWIDFNNDGDFGDPGEQIFASTTLVAGSNALSFTVPCASAGGSLYSRFRVSSAGGLGPAGPAADGEVEDHLIQGAQQADFGDAPDSYGTRFASGGPRHGVAAGSSLFLGSCVDSEADASAPLDGSGDDGAAGGTVAGNCSAGDDEDGVAFPSPLVACAAGSIAVTSSAAGRLDAWIDFDRNGRFDEPAERIANALALGAGTTAVTLNLPCTTVPGPSYGRFRLSSGGGLGVGGASVGGEVEDHVLTLQGADWGDAPDSYATTQASNGPRHGELTGFSLGATIDVEGDGQPSPAADGDGADEDGLLFTDGTRLDACTTHDLGVILTNTAGVATPRLDAWIDFDADGRFDDPRDRIATGLALVAGSNPLSVAVPCDVTSHATTYARLRLSSAGAASAQGAAIDGEVEDYTLVLGGFDYGDAPAPYPTRRAEDGARHRLLATANPLLGSSVDSEADGQPSAAANGDDLAGTPDDEDGAVFVLPLVPGTDGRVTLTAGATGGLVDGWIDFNRDGDFDDAGEQILSSHALGAAQSEAYDFPVPVGAANGSSIARLRISTAGGLGPAGLAADGEIEDHLVAVGSAAPSLGLAKQRALVERDSPFHYRVSYDLYIANTGNVPLSDVRASDDLAVTFLRARSFARVSLSSTDFAVNPGYNGVSDIQLLAAGNNLAVGAVGRLRLVVRIELGQFFGPFDNSATGTATAPGGGVVSDLSQDGTNPDPDSNGNPGDNSVPTPVSFDVVLPVAAPALGPLGLLLLAALLALLALSVQRQRRRRLY